MILAMPASRRTYDFLRALLLPLAILAVPGPVAWAQVTEPDRRIAFDIPSQSLDAALSEYFRVTGVQLLYNSAVTAGRRSSSIHGTYSARTALQLLLAGTGLVARYGRSDAVFIDVLNPSSESTPVPIGRIVVREKVPIRGISPLERLAYYDTLRDELQELLRGEKRLDGYAFSITLRFRVDTDGKIQDLNLARGSGRSGTDKIVAQLLESATVTKPPPALPQPLSMTLNGRWRK